MTALPDGPRFAVLNSVGIMRDPYGWYRALFAKFPDPVTIRSLNGTVVMTAHSEGVKEIFTAKPDTFAPFGTEVSAPLLGRHSVLVVSGPVHASRRKLMAPPFHGERMHAFGEIFRAAARRHLGSLKPGTPFVMQHVTAAITLEAIVEAVFGIRDPVEVERWSVALASLMTSVPPSALFIKALQTSMYPPFRTFQQRVEAVNALIRAQVAGRRTASEPGSDILSMLLAARFEDGAGMEEAELRDQLITLLAAGHETTATALAWALYWLERTPKVREALLEELAGLGPEPSPRKVAELPLLDAVCHEALRLNPIAPDIIRKLLKPMTLRGHEVPVGLHVGVSVSAVHENPEIYEDARSFRPDRFLGKSYSPFEYLPFGGGARRCLGAAFALYEMKVVLATALTEFAPRLVRDDEIPAVRRNLTMGPKGGVEMVLPERGARAGAA